MPLKKRFYLNWTLYVITDETPDDATVLPMKVRRALEGGASVIQIRNKKASDRELVTTGKKVLALTKEFNVPLIINDRIHVAKEIGADGVHLGQEDGPLIHAREVLGEHALIGRSTHSQNQAIAAEAEGFDYIGVGPIFVTPTKPDYHPVGLNLVKFAATQIGIPFVAIGGIDAGNAAIVRRAGAKTIAVVRAVMAQEDITQATIKLYDIMREGNLNAKK